MPHIKILKDVVDWGLCTGCGACHYACTRKAVSLVNVENVGIRPRFDAVECTSCSACLPICPGYTVDGDLETHDLPKNLGPADHEFGSAMEIWEGFAADPEIRFRASSGGILSALALYCLERENMEFVLHAAMDPERPWTNTTVTSRTRAEILSRTGSRYSPASPCDGLREIEESDRPCVFIGKPCDTAAVAMLRRQRAELDQKLGLVLTFFCAGTPSSSGTKQLLQILDVGAPHVRSIRYRGEGWPGKFRVASDHEAEEKSLTYQESWGLLTHYRPLRCHLCPDGLGRVADISCGDAWEQFSENGDPGRSIVLVRTRRGQEILRRAREARYVQLERATAGSVLTAQSNLLQRRRELFGRMLAMRLFQIPIPKCVGFSLFRSWLGLPFLGKVRTVLGTARRIVRRNLWRRRTLFPPAETSGQEPKPLRAGNGPQPSETES